MNVDQGAPSAPLRPLCNLVPAPDHASSALVLQRSISYAASCVRYSAYTQSFPSDETSVGRREGLPTSAPGPSIGAVPEASGECSHAAPRRNGNSRIYRVPMARCDTQCNADRPPARAVPTPPPHSFLSSSSLLRRRRRQRRGGAASGGGAAAVAECGRALMNRYRSRLKLLLALPPKSLSPPPLPPPPSHVAARQPPPRRKALLSAAQRMDARRMEPLANSSACVRARLPLRHQLGRLCPATQRRPRPSGSGPPEDDEDRIVSAVDDELLSGREGRQRGAMFAT